MTLQHVQDTVLFSMVVSVATDVLLSNSATCVVIKYRSAFSIG